MSRIAAAWERIEAAIRAKAPAEQVALPAGAAPDVLDRVEAAQGFRFPAAVRESYLLHDGSNGLWICEQGFLMPLVAPESGHLIGFGVLDLWRGMAQVGEAMAAERSTPTGPIRSHWWNSRWVPLTENECGDMICLDFDPAPGGVPGQVIEWWHEQGAMRVLAPGFEEWLAGLINEQTASGDVGAVTPGLS
jgi:molybdopterin molybdotransferase